MVDHSLQGSSGGMASKKAAEIDAIKSWSSFTATEYGSDWGNFYISSRRSVSCTQSSGGWGCYLNSYPCKSGSGGYVAARPRKKS